MDTNVSISACPHDCPSTCALEVTHDKQKIYKEDVNAVKNVLNSKYITQGPLVKKFEEKISKFLKSVFIISILEFEFEVSDLANNFILLYLSLLTNNSKS